MNAEYCGWCCRWIVTGQDHFDTCPNANRGTAVISSYTYYGGHDRGWECPKCLRIYSPSTTECSICNEKLKPCKGECSCNNEHDIRE
jgi:hypothetical protein